MAFLGFSFSWRRAIGLSRAKGRISRAIGIPLSKSGRQQKLGRMVQSAGLGSLILLGLFGHQRRREHVAYVREQHGVMGCFVSLVRTILLLGLVVLTLFAVVVFISNRVASPAPTPSPAGSSAHR